MSVRNKSVAPDEYAASQQENARLREACEKARNSSGIYSHIAYALARTNTDLFYVNMHTGDYIEYCSDDECGMLVERRRAADFFESCEREAKLYVHPEDQDAFVSAMNRDFLSNALDQREEYEMIYRRIKDGRSFYVKMRISRMKDDGRFIVVSVRDVDELVMKRRAEERILEERIVYARLNAITGNFIVVYVVEPETDRYREFNSTDAYVQSFKLEKEGADFFERAREVTCRRIHPAGRGRFLTFFTKDNAMAVIERDGIFTLGYRLAMEGKPIHVQMKAAMVEERLWDVIVHNDEALQSGGVVIACGMARFKGDDCVAAVFDRADRRMYEDKGILKSKGACWEDRRGD